MPRTPATARRSIKPHVGALQYSAGSTATILGTGNTLDTTLSWAVSFDIDFTRGHGLTTTQGILTLKTDQATPFVFISLKGASGRGFEFGSSANFDRFFVDITTDPNFWNRYIRGWHQLLVTFDGVNRTLSTSYKIYLDGVSVGITDGSGFAGSTNQNAIGVAISGNGTFDMADLTIWNGGSTMTAAQVASWYNNYELPSGVTLIRRYQHTDLSGTTLTDSTGNQNGAIGTAVWSSSSLPTVARSAAAARPVATARTVVS